MICKVTHVDYHQRRRQLLIEATGRRAAEALAVLELGAALYLAVMVQREVHAPLQVAA